jgi:hypothetical protein
VPTFYYGHLLTFLICGKKTALFRWNISQRQVTHFQKFYELQFLCLFVANEEPWEAGGQAYSIQQVAWARH